MSTQIQRRRGTTAEHSTFTGVEGELTIDTTKDTAVVHDGTTVGGHPLQKQYPALGSASTPTYTFTGDTNTGLYSPGADQVAISTNSTGRLFIDSSGNGRLGSTTSASSTTPVMWSLGGQYTPDASVAYSNLKLKIWDDGTVAAGLTMLQSGPAYVAQQGGHHLFYTSSSGAPTERMRLDSSGRLGVGTSTPNAALEVVGSFYVNGADRKIINYDGAVDYGTRTANSVRFLTSDTERMRLDSSGRLGIGSSSPVAALTVVGSAGAGDAGIQITSGSSNVGSKAALFFVPSTSPSFSTGSAIKSERLSPDGCDLQFFTVSSLGNTPVRAMTIDSSQRVGIGTTSATTALHVKGIVRAHRSDDANPRYIQLSFEGGTSSLDTVRDDGQTSAIIFRQSSDNGSTYSERARIDSSGRLLVGTSSGRSVYGSNARLQVEGTDYPTSALNLIANSNTNSGTAPYLQFARSRGTTVGSTTIVQSGDRVGGITWAGANGSNLDVPAATIEGVIDSGTPSATSMPGRLVFSTTADGASSPTPRMTISSTGNLNIGRTSDLAIAPRISVENANFGIAINTTNGGAGNEAMRFYNAGTPVGTISTSGSSTAYNTSSDYRLKENVTAVTDGITRLQQLKPSRFNFIAEPGKTVDGFIAHEVRDVVPEAITGEKDAVDDEGNPVYQGIDQSKLVPLLTAALQEAIGEIESLKARVAGLESA